MKNLKYLLILIVAFNTLNSFSQKKEIKLTITVRDVYNKAVPGAVILFDDVRQSRVANSKGVFKAKVNKAPKEIAAFSPRIGITKIDYSGENNITITISKDNSAADTSTNKIADPIQFRDIYDYLRGKVAGVNIGLNNSIRIRGASTFSGGRSPLFVLNGVQVDETTFGQIVPTTILAVKVLKGPETARYGLQGANGVIEVKTEIKN